MRPTAAALSNAVPDQTDPVGAGVEQEFVRRLPGVELDVAAMVAAYQHVRALTAAPDEARRGADRLRSISLTHRIDAEDEFGDGNQSQFAPDGTKVYREEEFSVFNENLKGTYFWHVYRTLPFPVGRMRLMILAPRTIYQMHRDGTTRAHIAIHTTKDCRLVGPDGATFHIPADGRVYVADTRRRHTAYNAGVVERVHLAVSMADTEDAT